MALSELYARNAVTVGATEYSIPNGGTTLQNLTTNGHFHLWADPVLAMAKSDYYRLRIYEKVLSTSTKRVVMSQVMGNANAQVGATPSLMLMNGWDMTCQKVAGTDRTFDFSVRGNQTTVIQSYSISAVSISTTEISIVSGTSVLQTNTTAGVFQLWVDPVAAAMAKGDEFLIQIYEKVHASGTKRLVFSSTIMDVQTELWVSPMLHLMNGWDMTLKKISGTDRTFDASIRKAV